MNHAKPQNLWYKFCLLRTLQNKLLCKMEEAFTWQQKKKKKETKQIPAWIQVWKSPKPLCMQSAL